MIKVSIVIPVYQSEKYLKACLESVLIQSLKDIELICIDDASTDESGRILDQYAVRDARIRVIHLEENRQQGYGRNLGIQMSQGEYIYMLDSDDMIREDALKQLYDTAVRNCLDGILFEMDEIYEDDSLRKSFFTSRSSYSYEENVCTGAALFELLYANQDWTVYVQRQFWKREYLIKNALRFPEGMIHEDEVFSMEAIMLADRVSYCQIPFFIRRYRMGSVMTSQKSARNFFGYFRAFRELRLFRDNYHIRSEAFDRYLTHLYDLMVLYFPLFQEERDPEKWFPERQMYEEYLLFEGYQDAHNRAVGQFLDSFQPLFQYHSIYLFGAGIIAKRVMKMIRETSHTVEGFLVTDPKKNPSVLFGKPVYAAGEWKAGESTAVVVSVARRHHAEIEKLLQKKECPIFYYYNGKIYDRAGICDQ